MLWSFTGNLLQSPKWTAILMTHMKMPTRLSQPQSARGKSTRESRAQTAEFTETSLPLTLMLKQPNHPHHVFFHSWCMCVNLVYSTWEECSAVDVYTQIHRLSEYSDGQSWFIFCPRFLLFSLYFFFHTFFYCGLVTVFCDMVTTRIGTILSSSCHSLRTVQQVWAGN